tara:strand:+ start:16446 stop:17204 length:759 start_codon:yes stop_codon:yes gene_type:complete
VPEDHEITATFHARQPLTLCGIELAQLTTAFSPQLSLEALADDGSALAAGDPIATLRGSTRSALTAERTLLNFLQHLSGIATNTRTYVDALSGSRTRILDTRKTTPGYRYLEKYAVACGGGWNHRMGLFDRVMLKDNHLAAFGDDLMGATAKAVAQSRRTNPCVLVEMEVDCLEQISAALNAGVDIILLDNFSVPDLRKAKELIGDQTVTEISGNVTLDTLKDLTPLCFDFISTGALVHKSVWVDIGLDWNE